MLLRANARRFGAVLHRLVHHVIRPGLYQVIIRHLQVVPVGDPRCVPHDGTHNVRWIVTLQFGLSAGTHVVSDPRPPR